MSESRYAPLLNYINWKEMPRRSLGSAALLSFLAGIALPLGIFGGGLLVMGGFILLVTTSDLGMALYSTPLVGSALMLLAATVLLFVIMQTINTSSALQRRANREICKFTELSLFSGKAPTLYLRRFENENPELDGSTFLGSAGKGSHPLLLATVWDRSFENLLTKSVEHVGPLLCLNDPLKRRKTGHARRFEVRSTEWKEAVAHLLDTCNLVVMHYSGTTSLEWEAGQVVSKTRLPLLVWMPYLPAPDNRDPLLDGDGKERPWFEGLPSWLKEPIEAHGPMRIARFNSRTDGLLFLFGPDRRLNVVKVERSWLALKKRIPEFLSEAGIKPVPNTESKRARMPGMLATLGFVRLFPRAIGTIIFLTCLAALAGGAIWQIFH